MIEITILEYLKEKLGVYVGLEKPIQPENEKDRIVKYVLFEKIGSNEENHLTSSTYAFQSYDTSLFNAALLNNEVKKAVKEMIELDVIASINLNSDYNFTDTTTKQYRYQAIYDIKHY